MRSTVLLALLIVGIALGATAMAAVAPSAIKWHQPPDMDQGVDYRSWINGAAPRYQVADDFMCRDGKPITDVHWWGSYIPGPDGQVPGFMIQFRSDIPVGPNNPYSRPGELLYQTIVVDVPQTFYGVTANGETVFEYDAYIPPFGQEKGKIYWISIVAFVNDTQMEWGWHESRVQYNDASVLSYGGEPWEPIYNRYQRRVDMSFYLTTDGDDDGVKWSQKPDMRTGQDTWSHFGMLDTKVADDFLCETGLPITDLVWWGSYPAGQEQPLKPAGFIIRFYTDVPAKVDRPYSHPGDMIYEQPVIEYTENYVFTTADGEAVYQYQAQLPESFFQKQGNIYWLSIVAVLNLPDAWGWHESMQHFNDAAVIWNGADWRPLMQPTGAPADMSFMLLEKEPGGQGVAKWIQLPEDQYEGDYLSQISPNVPFDAEVADDFLCEDGAPISDVHWWGSYWKNVRGPLKGFWIRFYSDIPWNPDIGFSRPGKPIAEYYVDDYHETYYGIDGMGENVYQYYAILPEWFKQEKGEVYWISIVADSNLPPLWGWHDSRFMWNDDAVRREPFAGHPEWDELYNNILGVSTNMAFELTSPTVARAPFEYFNPLWVWFSIPLSPVGSSDVSDVLGFNARNKVTRWNPITKNLELYSDDFGDIEVGRGYTLYTLEIHNPIYEGIIPAKIVHLPRRGVSWIGLPGVDNYFLAWASVENLTTGEVRTAMEDYASANPWMNWNFIYWNTFAETAQICTFVGGSDDTYMHPWYGYRVWSNVDDLRLIFNEP